MSSLRRCRLAGMHRLSTRSPLLKALAAVRLVARSGPRQFAGVLLAGCVAGAMPLPAAWATQHLVDGLSAGTFGAGMALALATMVAGFAAAATQVSYLSAIVGASLEARSRIRSERLLLDATMRHVGTEFLDDPDEHDSLTLAREGIRMIPTLIPSAIVEVVSTLVTFVGYGVLLWSSWPLMVLALVAVSAPTAYIQVRINHASGRIVERNAPAQRWERYFGSLFVTPDAARDMRLHGSSGYLRTRFDAALSQAQWSEVAAVKKATGARMALVGAHGLVVVAGTAWAAVGAAHGRVTVGDFVLFTTAVMAIQTRAASLLNLQGRLSVSLRLFGHYQRFVRANSTSTASELSHVPLPTPCLSDAIHFEDVWFRYSEDQEWILRGLNLTIPAGKTTALVGPNGAGKSTIVRLLLRLNTPSRGRVLWDGVDIARFDPVDYRRHVTGVLQERPRYEMSLRDNVSLGRDSRLGSGGPDEATYTELAAARLTGMIESLPHGADTMLSTQRRDASGDAGITLSGGQWDRVAVARARYAQLLGEPIDLVVLDEPNAGLDPISEAQLMGDILAFGEGATRLIISHRLGLVAESDHVVVMSDGEIRERGSRSELLARGGNFQRMFSVQAATYVMRDSGDVVG